MKNLRHNFLIFAILTLFSALTQAQWQNGQAATAVIGQPDFTTGAFSQYPPTDSTLYLFYGSDGGVLFDSVSQKLYVFDPFHNRVLRFSYQQPGEFGTNRPKAEAVFGQPNFTTDAIIDPPTEYSMNNPTGGAILSDTLWVADYGNNRVLGFYNISSKPSMNAAADVVLGQTNFSSNSSSTSDTTMSLPRDITIDPQTRAIYVADYGNNRIIRFNANHQTTGSAADIVFGQDDFTTVVSGNAPNRFGLPQRVYFSNNNLFVSESHRVVRFNNVNAVTANGDSADVVFGQPDFETSSYGTTASKMKTPRGIAVDGAGRLYVAENDNCRIIIFPDAFTNTNGTAATTVIGWQDFDHLPSFYFTTDTTFLWPDGIALDIANRKLFVADNDNNRIMVFTASSALPVELQSFTATVNGSAVELHWSTATETNNYGFEIERKSNDEWEAIGFVEGQGTINAPHYYSFVDSRASGTVTYRLKQMNRDGTFEYSQSIEVYANGIPTNFALSQNHPNPFNPATVITYQLPVQSRVTLKVYDVLGKEVATLVNESKGAGVYDVAFDASRFSSGMYFYRLQAGSYTSVKKMIVTK